MTAIAIHNPQHTIIYIIRELNLLALEILSLTGRRVNTSWPHPLKFPTPMSHVYQCFYMGKWSHVVSFIWSLARLVFGLILTWRIHSVVVNVGILKVGARMHNRKPVMSLKSDSFSVFFLLSRQLAKWVTHSSVKLNVKDIFFLENKNTCWQRWSILLKTYFYLDHNSLQFT